MTPSDKWNNTTITYTFKGITYELVDDKRDKRVGWKEQVIRDFLHCEETKDWVTIKNRISNGLMWGWLKEVEEKNEQGFW
jgi:hypothetical protein